MKYHQGLAYEQVSGIRGSVIFCGGFASSMYGRKASALHEFCKKHDISFTRFDYSGHGNSKGEFHNGNIGKWLEDGLNILCNLTDGKQIVIGSSMGGWIMLLMALKHPERIKSLIGIATAPDFTQDLSSTFSVEQQKEITSHGYTRIPSSVNDNPYFITRDLILDGERNFVLNQSVIAINVPVVLLHGMNDHVVPYTKSLELAKKLQSSEVSVELLKSSDHSMSDEKSLSALYKNILNFTEN
ncbi:MAG: alpha/beta hydrolase [Rickettsiaceae bacterium H1]|nr:alpha/beta hydrolase [Rickettsiaceae bacterium H1]